jgi:cyclase
MLKKRIIFTLLYDSGFFMLSRNFRLQKVGNLEWLQHNYNFGHISFYIDELVILDVSRGARDFNLFCEVLKTLTQGCFVPIAAGGGVRTVDQARQLLRSGADKIVINTPLFTDQRLVKNLAVEFGQQCIVGSVDMSRNKNGAYDILIDSGSSALEASKVVAWEWLEQQSVGEVYLNSIDQDGTGQGLDFSLLDQVPIKSSAPVILAGGIGNKTHIAAGLADSRIDAVATANLFNFVGDGLKHARESIVSEGGNLATWPNPSILTPFTLKKMVLPSA